MHRFRKILCVADLDESRNAVLERAVGLAERHEAELHVVDVVESPPAGRAALGDGWSEAASLRARSRQLDEALAPFRQRIRIEARTLVGTPFLRIIEDVLREGHDLVIRRCEKPAWLDRAFGSDDMQLLRQCPCPVWLVDPAESHPCRRILAAVDLDTQYPAEELETRHALNRRILEQAASMAIVDAAELHVVHAWYAPPPSSSYLGMPADLVSDYVSRSRAEHRRTLDRLMRETRDTLGEVARSLVLREHLVDGYPRRLIPELTRELEVDLIVMGSVARTGIPGFVVGNTAEMIFSQLDCAVLVVKPPGFVTPVVAGG